MRKPPGPKILVLDIETIPLEVHVWSLWGNERIGLNQLMKDWSVLSWAAKWLGKRKIFHEDVSGQKNLRDDKKILSVLWKLLDECDILVGHNLRSFDRRKVNARFAIHGLNPPSPYRVIDTKELVRKHFDFTSSSLEYISGVICKRHKKLKHKQFPGQELWTECLKKNPKAWKEMRLYNCADVLAAEEIFKELRSWGTGVDLSSYYGDVVCQCGSARLQRRGIRHQKTGWFQQYQCQDCGTWIAATGEKNNLMPKHLRDRIRKIQ